MINWKERKKILIVFDGALSYTEQVHFQGGIINILPFVPVEWKTWVISNYTNSSLK